MLDLSKTGEFASCQHVRRSVRQVVVANARNADESRFRHSVTQALRIVSDLSSSWNRQLCAAPHPLKATRSKDECEICRDRKQRGHPERAGIITGVSSAGKHWSLPRGRNLRQRDACNH